MLCSDEAGEVSISWRSLSFPPGDDSTVPPPAAVPSSLLCLLVPAASLAHTEVRCEHCARMLQSGSSGDCSKGKRNTDPYGQWPMSESTIFVVKSGLLENNFLPEMSIFAKNEIPWYIIPGCVE